MSDFEKLINASDLIEWIMEAYPDWCMGSIRSIVDHVEGMPSAQLEDYTELKQEFIQMASYIDTLLECSDAQKETLIGFISRLAEFMPWTERD